MGGRCAWSRLRIVEGTFRTNVVRNSILRAASGAVDWYQQLFRALFLNRLLSSFIVYTQAIKAILSSNKRCHLFVHNMPFTLLVHSFMLHSAFRPFSCGFALWLSLAKFHFKVWSSSKQSQNGPDAGLVKPLRVESTLTVCVSLHLQFLTTTHDLRERILRRLRNISTTLGLSSCGIRSKIP